MRGRIPPHTSQVHYGGCNLYSNWWKKIQIRWKKNRANRDIISNPAWHHPSFSSFTANYWILAKMYKKNLFSLESDVSELVVVRHKVTPSHDKS